MFEAFRESWELLQSSCSVLRKNPRMLWLPVFGAVYALVLVAVAIGLVWPEGGDMRTLPQTMGPAEYAFYFLIYCLGYTGVTFFNAALAHTVLSYVRTGRFSLKESLGFSMERLFLIIQWSLLASTAGVLLDIFTRGRKGGGVLVNSLLGMAWSLMIFFVVPIIVNEGIGPWRAVKVSVGMLRQKWGTQVTTSMGFGAIEGVLVLPAAVGLGLGMALMFSGASLAGGVLLAGVSAVAMAWVFLGFSALGMILRTIFYVQIRGEKVASMPISGDVVNRYFS